MDQDVSGWAVDEECASRIAKQRGSIKQRIDGTKFAGGVVPSEYKPGGVAYCSKRKVSTSTSRLHDGFKIQMIKDYLAELRTIRQITRRAEKYLGRITPRRYIDPTTGYIILNPVMVSKTGAVIEQRTSGFTLPAGSSKFIPVPELEIEIKEYVQQLRKEIEQRKLSIEEKKGKAQVNKKGLHLMTTVRSNRRTQSVEHGDDQNSSSDPSGVSPAYDSDGEADANDDFEDDLLVRVECQAASETRYVTDALSAISSKLKRVRNKWNVAYQRKRLRDKQREEQQELKNISFISNKMNAFNSSRNTKLRKVGSKIKVRQKNSRSPSGTKVLEGYALRPKNSNGEIDETDIIEMDEPTFIGRRIRGKDPYMSVMSSASTSSGTASIIASSFTSFTSRATDLSGTSSQNDLLKKSKRSKTKSRHEIHRKTRKSQKNRKSRLQTSVEFTDKTDEGESKIPTPDTTTDTGSASSILGTKVSGVDDDDDGCGFFVVVPEVPVTTSQSDSVTDLVIQTTLQKISEQPVDDVCTPPEAMLSTLPLPPTDSSVAVISKRRIVHAAPMRKKGTSYTRKVIVPSPPSKEIIPRLSSDILPKDLIVHLHHVEREIVIRRKKKLHAILQYEREKRRIQAAAASLNYCEQQGSDHLTGGDQNQRFDEPMFPTLRLSTSCSYRRKKFYPTSYFERLSVVR